MIDDNEVDYAEKSRNIFNLINKFRPNPRELAIIKKNSKNILIKIPIYSVNLTKSKFKW